MAEPPLKLKTELPDELELIQLERYVVVDDDHVRRRAKVLVITNETNPEMILCVHDEFQDIIAE